VNVSLVHKQLLLNVHVDWMTLLYWWMAWQRLESHTLELWMHWNVLDTL